MQEASLRIGHPNVVRVIDSGSHDGSVYMVLELFTGEPLDARIDG